MNLTCQSIELMSLKHVRLVQETELGQAPKQHTASQTGEVQTVTRIESKRGGSGWVSNHLPQQLIARTPEWAGTVLTAFVAGYMEMDKAFSNVLHEFGKPAQTCTCKFIFVPTGGSVLDCLGIALANAVFHNIV